MPITIVSIAAATAVVGFDMLANRPDIALSSAPRTLRAMALTGSAAAGDSAIDIKVANRTVASLFNTNTGFPTNDADKFDTQFAVPAGAPVSVIVTDAPATNPLNLLIDV